MEVRLCILSASKICVKITTSLKQKLLIFSVSSKPYIPVMNEAIKQFLWNI